MYLPISVHTQCDVYTTGKEFIATELILYIMERKFMKDLLGKQTGHQLPSVAKAHTENDTM